MSKVLTTRELLELNLEQVALNSSPGIDANLILQGKTLDEVRSILSSDQSIRGVEVLTDEDKSLGFISRQVLNEYIKTQMLNRISAQQKRGGDPKQGLEGDPVRPRFQCNCHHPPYQRLVGIQRREPPHCRICGELMQVVENK